MRRASSRVELPGYWLPERGGVYGLLVGAFEFKQKAGRGKGKLRITYVLKLLEPTHARVKLEGGGYDEAELAAGELCGVFGGPGLTRELADKYGCKVELHRQTEKKELQNGNAMWLYDVDWSGKLRTLPVRKWVETTPTEPESGDTPESDAEEDASFNPDDFEF